MLWGIILYNICGLKRLSSSFLARINNVLFCFSLYLSVSFWLCVCVFDCVICISSSFITGVHLTLHPATRHKLLLISFLCSWGHQRVLSFEVNRYIWLNMQKHFSALWSLRSGGMCLELSEFFSIHTNGRRWRSTLDTVENELHAVDLSLLHKLQLGCTKRMYTNRVVFVCVFDCACMFVCVWVC